MYKSINSCFLLLFTVSSFSRPIDGARILGIFPPPSYSHFILCNSLMTALAEKGHDVTVISPYYEGGTNLTGFKNIVLTGLLKKFEDKRAKFFDLNEANYIFSEVFINVHQLELARIVLDADTVQELLKSDEEFDVVIVEDFIAPALKGFCYHYNAPCITFNSLGLSRLISTQTGNPISPSYIPDYMLPYGSNMNFLERFHNTLAYIFSELLKQWYVLPNHNILLQKYFPGAPHINDLYYNVSLVLSNSHLSTHQPVPLVPNIVEVGGLHIKPSKPLSKDLQEYLDDAKDGAIYFSLGSNLKTVEMPKEKLQSIVKAFSKLKQKVLWKWEGEEFPGKPPNVKFSKWLPQSDILAHPNIRLFITHGGLLSTTEAVFHGMPMLGIPICCDQKVNLANAINNGFAVNVAFSDLNEENLFQAVQEMLNNPRYLENAKRSSSILRDQPLPPLERALYWIEYVLRHNGAPHLRSAAINLTWYQYLLLDVVVLVFGLTSGLILILYFIIDILFCKRRKYVTAIKKTN